MARIKRNPKKPKAKKVHINEYSDHSKAEQVRKEMEKSPIKLRKPAGKRVRARNIYGGRSSLYNFMIQPEGYYISEYGIEIDNDLTRLF